MAAPVFEHDPGPGHDLKFPGAGAPASPHASPFTRTRGENFFSRLMKRQLGAPPAPLKIPRPGEAPQPAWSPHTPGRPLTYWLPDHMARYARWQDLEARNRATKASIPLLPGRTKDSTNYQEMVRHAARFHLPAIMRAAREFVCQATVSVRVASERSVLLPAEIGSDYLVLRLAGYTQKQIVEDLLPDHHLAHAGAPCACYVRRSSMDPWAQNLEDRARRDRADLSIPHAITLNQRRLHNLWSFGLAHSLPSLRLHRIGSFDPNISLEALCLKWPLASRPAALAPWMAPGSQGPGPQLDDPALEARMAWIASDWHVYQAQARVIGRALSRSGEHRMVYLLAHRSQFCKEGDSSLLNCSQAWSDAFFTGGLAIDLAPPSPGIYSATLGFFPLPSAAPDDDYLLWLLAFLLMDGQTHQVDCYSVDRDFLPVPPRPLEASEHPARPGPFPRLVPETGPLSDFRDFREIEKDLNLESLPLALRRSRPFAISQAVLRLLPFKARIWVRPETPPPPAFRSSARSSPAFASALPWGIPGKQPPSEDG